MFESIGKTSFMGDEDFEDGNFFLDHFHTTAELRLKLNDPLNPNTKFWGSGECMETFHLAKFCIYNGIMADRSTTALQLVELM